MSRIGICGPATAAVLLSPEKFANRPAYFADVTVSNNELLEILNEIDGGEGVWSKKEVSLGSWFEEAKKLWWKDTEEGVKDRLSTKAYGMLGTYGVFEEGDRYGADFSDKVEEGFGISREEFKEILRKLVK